MSAAPGLAAQIGLLLRTAHRRGAGRRARSRRLFRARAARTVTADWGSAGFLLVASVCALLHAGLAALVLICSAQAGADHPARAGLAGAAHHLLSAAPAGRAIASIGLLWWSAVLVCQGEGAELDTQQQRHPVWEFLFSLPVRPAAVFAAELLAPLAANPVIVTAPLLPALFYALVYGPGWGLAAIPLAGLLIAVAAAGLGKAIEIFIMLRTPPRTRGGLLGVLGWFGSVGLFAPLFLLFGGPARIAAAARFLAQLAPIPWPFDGFIGAAPDGTHDPWRGLATIWIGTAITLLLAAAIARLGFAAGLTGASDRAVRRPAAPGAFGRMPLMRKELLWFARDRSALVQALLVPLTLASIQLVNLRSAFEMGRALRHSEWTSFAAASILFGTYFLGVLGPRSLASEGAALWISETWPLGLEPLLRAKARLWWLLASALVLAILAIAAIRAPSSLPWLALVFLGWLPFGRSIALRAVTMVTPASAAGQTARAPAGRRGAPFIGVFAFIAGITTWRASLAVLGIVLSELTSAAMWQGFRARLPLLNDEWASASRRRRRCCMRWWRSAC